MGDLDQVATFLNEARRRLGECSDLREARLLKTTITGLEKHFNGGTITLEDTEAFMTVFFGGPHLRSIRDLQP